MRNFTLVALTLSFYLSLETCEENIP
ncbi:hypothetical protein CCP3SC15_2530003 [Gammaproteobacteria bacterium]